MLLTTWTSGTMCVVCGVPAGWERSNPISLMKIAYLRTVCCSAAGACTKPKHLGAERVEMEFATMCDKDYSRYIERVKNSKLPAGESLEAALAVLK